MPRLRSRSALPITRRRRVLAGMVACLALGSTAHAAGEIERGAVASRNCLACHSFVSGQHMTGPSLGALWGRRAGTAMGFARYSEALKKSGIVWDERSLDAWLRNPAALVPGNTMPFGGIADAGTRADLLAYLQAVSAGRVPPPGPRLPDLKLAEAARVVTAVRYCGDTYRVTTGDGRTRLWWEFNLRFKTDGGEHGPAAGKPVLVGNGMQGDRGAIVFSRPEDISAFVKRACE
jgi:cytochrome c